MWIPRWSLDDHRIKSEVDYSLGRQLDLSSRLLSRVPHPWRTVTLALQWAAHFDVTCALSHFAKICRGSQHLTEEEEK